MAATPFTTRWLEASDRSTTINAIFEKHAGPTGLIVFNLHVLALVLLYPGLKSSELAHRLGREATSFTPNLDQLENGGFIERQLDQSDRRVKRIYPTEQAVRQRDEILQALTAADAEASPFSFTLRVERPVHSSLHVHLVPRGEDHAVVSVCWDNNYNQREDAFVPTTTIRQNITAYGAAFDVVTVRQLHAAFELALQLVDRGKEAFEEEQPDARHHGSEPIPTS